MGSRIMLLSFGGGCRQPVVNSIDRPRRSQVIDLMRPTGLMDLEDRPQVIEEVRGLSRRTSHPSRIRL